MTGITIKMYSYLNIGREVHPDRINLENHQNNQQHTLDLISLLLKFKLEVFTVPTKALACSMTCDPCQPNTFKGYWRVSIYVGAGYLIQYVHALKPFRITSSRFRTDKYIVGEVPSLKKHRDPSSTLIILILFLQTNSKWSKYVLTRY